MCRLFSSAMRGILRGIHTRGPRSRYPSSRSPRKGCSVSQVPPDPGQGQYQQPPPGGYQPPPPPPGGSYGAPAPTPGAVYQSPTGQPLAEWPQRALGGLIDFVAPWIVVNFFFFIIRGAIGFLFGSVLWL